METKNIFIDNIGFDFGGSMTLGREYRKLGFKTYFRNFVKKKDKSIEDLKNEFDVTIFNELEDIIPEIVELQPEKIVFVPNYKDISDRTYQPIRELKKKTGAEIILISGSRLNDFAKEEIAYFKETDCPYDMICCLSDVCIDVYKEITDNVKFLDINAFTFKDKIEIQPYEKRNKVLFSAGRIESVKGFPKYLKNADRLLKNLEGYAMAHEGADFKISKKSGKVSGPIHVVDILTEDLKTKKLKEFNCLHEDFSTQPVLNKINYYPTFDYKEAKDRWKNYLALVYPVLGVYKDKPLKKVHRDKALNYWRTAKEYGILEIVNEGTLVFLSEDFAKLFDIDIPEIVYKNFEEIPEKLKAINKNNYEAIMKKVIDKFKNDQEEVNRKILELLG